MSGQSNQGKAYMVKLNTSVVIQAQIHHFGSVYYIYSIYELLE